MKIINQRQIVEDNWQTIDEETPLDQLPAANLIISLSYWQKHKNSLSQRNEPLGVKLKPEDEITDIAKDLEKLALVVLEFPAFRDGRAYSQARQLRQHFGYQNEIRATGNVLRDQLTYMERVGFTSFEIDSKQDINDALNAFDEINVKYQASSDEALPLFKRRRA